MKNIRALYLLGLMLCAFNSVSGCCSNESFDLKKALHISL